MLNTIKALKNLAPEVYKLLKNQNYLKLVEDIVKDGFEPHYEKLLNIPPITRSAICYLVRTAALDNNDFWLPVMASIILVRTYVNADLLDYILPAVEFWFYPEMGGYSTLALMVLKELRWFIKREKDPYKLQKLKHIFKELYDLYKQNQKDLKWNLKYIIYLKKFKIHKIKPSLLEILLTIIFKYGSILLIFYLIWEVILWKGL